MKNNMIHRQNLLLKPRHAWWQHQMRKHTNKTWHNRLQLMVCRQTMSWHEQLATAVNTMGTCNVIGTPSPRPPCQKTNATRWVWA